MPRLRFKFVHAPAASIAALIGVALISCRPGVDQPPVGPEVRVEVRTHPRDVRVGAPFGTPAVVEVLDREDLLVSKLGWTVRATIFTGPGQIVSGGEVGVVNGVATFTNLIVIGPVDGNVRLAFQLLEDAVPNPSAIDTAITFRLLPGPPTSIAAQPPTSTTGAPGQIVTPAPSVIIRDAGGNPLVGVPVDFSIASGEGRITGATQSTTNTEGVAVVSGWALGLPGTNQLKASLSPTQEVTFSAAVSTTAGMMRIRLNGAPAGVPVKVRVFKTSAAGTIYDNVHDVLDSLTVTNLPFGTYQVSGDSAKVGARIWVADAAANNLNVSATSGPSITLNYREHGRFEITARGLPSPTQTGVIDFLPTAGESALLFSVTALNDAVTRGNGPIGTYDVVPRTVVVSGQQFSASPARQSVVLSGGGPTASMTFTYAVATGTLTVTLAGTLPSGTSVPVDVTGPGGFRETVFMTNSRTWTGLAPGTYTIVASPVTVANVTFRPTPATSVVNVSAGATTAVTITYNP